MTLPPGTDLTRRLAAANAAAMAGPPVRETTWRDIVGPDEDDNEDDNEDEGRDERAAGGGRRRRLRRPERSAPAAEPSSLRVRQPAAPVDTSRGSEAAPRRRAPWRLAIVLGVAVVAALLLRTFVMAPYYIPSASMEPTLHGCAGCNNDHVLVNKLSYRMHDIRRGDVVVFHRPSSWQVSQKLLVKRVIGLPGDVLTTKGGVVYVNGLLLDEPYVDDDCTAGTTDLSRVTVPAGSIFVMGDNRCQSEDSRRFGSVRESDVLGRAFVIVWPLGRLHWI
ncbi:MAG: signal peptidase [Pseudonocardiales bacterium]|nr:signal peptidase [Pseudonocardiales bacterium]